MVNVSTMSSAIQTRTHSMFGVYERANQAVNQSWQHGNLVDRIVISPGSPHSRCIGYQEPFMRILPGASRFSLPQRYVLGAPCASARCFVCVRRSSGRSFWGPAGPGVPPESRHGLITMLQLSGNLGHPISASSSHEAIFISQIA